MKREGERGDYDGPPKRTRGNSERTQIRILIQSKAAGSVIGKGGHNITRLRTENNATITVPDCLGPERVLSIEAESETAVRIAQELLPNLNEGESELRVLVHQSQAGCIIGRAGFKIKELRDKTGIQIKVYTSCCPQSTDRVVQLTGANDGIIECLADIIDLLESSPVKGPNQPYAPTNYDEYFSAEYGGFGEPPSRGGPPGRAGFGPMGPRGAISPREMSGGFGPPSRAMGRPPPDFNPVGHGIRGSYSGGRAGGGRNPVNFASDEMDFSGGGSRSSFGPPSLLSPRGLLSNHGMEDANGTMGETQQVSIPKDLAGAIIGKGGARIRKIRSDSGANITIEEAGQQATERVITIKGTNTQIQMAQYLLQKSVRENSGPNYRF